MKRKIIGLFLVLTLIVSVFICPEELNAADIQTISFQVLYGQSDARKMVDMINEAHASALTISQTKDNKQILVLKGIVSILISIIVTALIAYLW